MFQVTLENTGTTFYLRGTTWAFHQDRGNTFETKEAAEAGIARAKKFLPRAVARNIKIVEA